MVDSNEVDALDGADEAANGSQSQYDPDTMEGVVADDAFDASPQWVKDRFSRFAKKNRATQEQLDAERARSNALESRLANVEQRVNTPQQAEAPKEGLAAIEVRDLKDFLHRGERALVAAARDPENEEVRQQLAEVDPVKLEAVREEIRRRELQAAISEYDSKSQGQAQMAAKATAVQNRMVREFGNDVLNPRSELHQAAVAEFRSLQEDFPGDDTTGLVTYDAFKAAYAKLNRDTNRGGSGLSDADRRRLAVAGQTRREAGQDSTIAALNAKGDFLSKRKADNLTLDQALAEMFPD